MITENTSNPNSPTKLHTEVKEVSKDAPCRHCGKPDWCYRLGDLEVCKRGAVAEGYYKTSRQDKESSPYLAPISQKKPPRPKQERIWYYDDRDGNRLVRVVRVDYGDGKKKIWQEHYQDGRWVKGLGDVKREDIPVYRYKGIVSTAAAFGFRVFVTEGEPCSDAMNSLLLTATTNIMGSGKWTDSDSACLKGAEIVICPDMDKPGVKHFLDIYKRHPDAKVLLPYPGSPLWDNLPESGGRDVADWIEEYHLTKDDVLKQVMDITPELIERLERQLQLHSQPSSDATDGHKGKVPKADIMGSILAEDYQDKLAYNNENGRWMFYGLEQYGIWQSITDEVAESIISKELDSRGISGYGSHRYIKDVLCKMRSTLIQTKWNEVSASDYLPFQDRILNLKTGEVIEHSPGFRFTWCLPRDYDENATDWSLIDCWLDGVTGDNDELKNIIICYCNAVLKGRHELQKSLFTTGHGGTGKTTLQNLVVELIGERNVHTTSLRVFCSNNFETANAYGKRLIIFPDEDKYSGDLQRFKDLIGNGWLRIERKNKDVEGHYKYKGMVMMASNFPVFVSEQTSAIKRRIITVPFTRTPGKIDTHLLEKLVSQLNAFTNHLLSLSDDFVAQTLLGANECTEVAYTEWEQRLVTDSVAAWLNEYVIRDEKAKTQIGDNKDEAKDKENGVFSAITLFGSYHRRCTDTGRTPLSNTKFSRQLVEICNNILGWKDVHRKPTNRCNVIFGLRLRVAGVDDHIPTLEEIYMEKIEGQPSTPSTFQSQQALQPSTLPSTTPSTEPSTSNDDDVSITYTVPLFNPEWRVEGQVEGQVEGMVEGSNPYQIKKVEGVEGSPPLFIKDKNNPFKEGDNAFYCGDDKDWWGEKVLVKEVLGKTKVAIGVIGGFGKLKRKECHFSDLSLTLPETKN